MPTYEYKCDACDYAFERFQSITAAPVKRCPECGKAKVRRLISAGAGLIFKGSGFYITDYRDKSYADKAKADSGGGDGKGDAKGDAAGGDSKSGDAKGDGKSDAKGESKADSKSESKPAETKPAATKSEPNPAKSAEPKPPKKKS